MAGGFVSNWAKSLVAWGAVQKLEAEGLTPPTTKTIERERRRHIGDIMTIAKRAAKYGIRISPTVGAPVTRSSLLFNFYRASGEIVPFTSSVTRFEQALDANIEAGSKFAADFKESMERSGWFMAYTNPQTGATRQKSDHIQWKRLALPFFDQLTEEASFIDRQTGVIGRQIARGAKWLGSLSALGMAWQGVSDVMSDYRNALDANLRSTRRFADAEREAYRVIAGFDIAKAARVAAEFNEDYASIRKVLLDYRAYFLKDISIQQLRSLAAIGQLTGLATADVFAYQAERRREYGIAPEQSERELLLALRTYNQTADVIGKSVTSRPWRATFFQALRQAQASSRTLPRDISVIASVVGETLKYIVQEGSITSQGELATAVDAAIQIANSDPNIIVQVGDALDQKLREETERFKQASGAAPISELEARHRALSSIFGDDLMPQVRMVDEYYRTVGGREADARTEMAKLFMQNHDGVATALEIFQRTLKPQGMNQAFAEMSSYVKDKRLAVLLAKMATQGDFGKIAKTVRQQGKQRQEDLKRAEEDRIKNLKAASTWPRRVYSLFAGAWAWPWTKVLGGIALALGALGWDLAIRRRLRIDLAATATALGAAAARWPKARVQAPGAIDATKKPGWARRVLSRVWEAMRSMWGHIKEMFKWYLNKLGYVWRGIKWLGRAVRDLLRLSHVRKWRRARWIRKARVKMKLWARRRRRAPKSPGRVGRVITAATVALDLGLTGWDYLDRKTAAKKLAAQEKEARELRESLAREKAQVSKARPLTPRDVADMKITSRIFAFQDATTALEQYEYATTFDLSQTDAEVNEARDHLAMQMENGTELGAKIAPRGITISQAAEMMKNHRPELHLGNWGNAVIDGLHRFPSAWRPSKP